MTNPNDAAFSVNGEIPDRSWHPTNIEMYEKYAGNGLTKREYFAAMAMQGLMTKPKVSPTWSEAVLQRARIACAMADALIVELNHVPE